MKTYRKVQVNYEREEEDKTFCDICKEDVDQQRRKIRNRNSYYYRSEVEIEFGEGNVYPEGGTMAYQTFDLCGECWKTKLVPWFATFGAKPREKEVDF